MGITMERRDVEVVSIPVDQIQSGDFFGILRLDGIDTMLAWAMGASHTGHMVVALRIDGQMNICESTTISGYWPVNGLQCTEYEKWISQALAADMNVVWLPLSPEVRALFNETAAVEFTKRYNGLDYGFTNILWAWIDSLSDNYPYPLTWQLHELLPALVGKIAPQIADLLWNQAFNLRLGTEGLTTAEIYQELHDRGMTFGDLVKIPENENWVYIQRNNANETVRDRSMVCDVYVCELWKAAGLFGDLSDKFHCTEATNWDIYTLNVFDNGPLPEQCQLADPQLPFCQILGKYRLRLPFFNTRQVYPNSFNNCPRGSPPDYDKPVGC